MAFKDADTATRLRVPYAQHVVKGSGNELLLIRAPRQGPHHVAVALKCVQVVAGVRIPQLDWSALGPSQYDAAVWAEGADVDLVRVYPELNSEGSRFSGLHSEFCILNSTVTRGLPFGARERLPER